MFGIYTLLIRKTKLGKRLNNDTRTSSSVVNISYHVDFPTAKKLHVTHVNCNTEHVRLGKKVPNRTLSTRNKKLVFPFTHKYGWKCMKIPKIHIFMLRFFLYRCLNLFLYCWRFIFLSALSLLWKYVNT